MTAHYTIIHKVVSWRTTKLEDGRYRWRVFYFGFPIENTLSEGISPTRAKATRAAKTCAKVWKATQRRELLALGVTP